MNDPNAPHSDPLDDSTETQAHTNSNVSVGMPGRIGQYSIKRAIATGGMGIVYEAIQDRPRRPVALKVMKHGVVSARAFRRFEHESQVLARLRHPAIAQVYEAGTHHDHSGPIPFFAMEYIPRAKTITRYAHDQGLDTKNKLELFQTVCEAIQHGHQRGIIHRDLKPSNLLVDGQGRVKVIDFGIAHVTDADLTITTLGDVAGELVGTLLYMSPEQFVGDPDRIEARCDIYSLGVVLYELLAERYPYDLSSFPLADAPRIILETTPIRLRKVERSFHGDLETIVEKAMEKNPDRRYQTVNALTEDIQHFLNDEPIIAHAPSATYRFAKWAHRRKVPLTIAVVLAVALAAVVRAEFKTRRALMIADAALASASRQLGDSFNPRIETHTLPRKKSIDELTQAIQLQPHISEPNLVQSYALRAKMQSYQKQWNAALRDCNLALDRDPNNSLALRTKGLVLLELGQFEAAMTAYDAGMQDPNVDYLPEDYHGRAKLRRLSGAYVSALEDHNRVVAAFPKRGVVRIERGITRRFADDIDGAIEDFELAGSYDSDWFIQSRQWIWEMRTLRNAPGDVALAEAALSATASRAQKPLEKAMLGVLRGTMEPDAALAVASHDSLRCCALYYLGVRALIDGRTDDAKNFFQQSRDTEQRGLPEYELAGMYLTKINAGL